MQSVRLLGHLRLCPSHSYTYCFLRRLNSKQVDWYSVLGVKFSAEQKEIKDNFYKLSKEFHPDLNKDENSLLKFKEIAEAYETLSNPERRKEYDQTMGFGIKRENVGRGAAAGGRRRPTGMKGVFRNGVFVDDEETPQMRNIEYDLSPERMEKVWARYKARWERVEEVSRLRDLEKKKEEFRRRVDLKREKMDQMSEAEKDEFLYKLRLLRPDAADESDSVNKEDDKEKIKNRKKMNSKLDEERERIVRKKKERAEELEQEWADRLEKEKMAGKREQEKQMRDVMMKQFGMTETKFEEMMEPNSNRNMGGKRSGYQREDEFLGGLDSSRDAGDWRSFMGKSIQGNKTKWERIQQGMHDSPHNNSPKYGVNSSKVERKFGVYMILGIVCSSLILLSIEFRSRDLDK